MSYKVKVTSQRVILIVASLFSFSLMAGTINTGNKERKVSNSLGFTEHVYKKMEKLQKLMSEEKYVEARIGFNNLFKKNLNKYEKAQVHQYIGWIDSSEGNYVAAAESFQNAINSDSLPNQAHFGMMLKMAELYYASYDNKKVVEILKKYYSEVVEINESAPSLEANAYLKMRQYNKAIPVLKKAISITEKSNEDLNLLLYAAHLELSQEAEASVVLETLIDINPAKKDYWKTIKKNN